MKASYNSIHIKKGFKYGLDWKILLENIDVTPYVWFNSWEVHGNSFSEVNYVKS